MTEFEVEGLNYVRHQINSNPNLKEVGEKGKMVCPSCLKKCIRDLNADCPNCKKKFTVLLEVRLLEEMSYSFWRNCYVQDL